MAEVKYCYSAGNAYPVEAQVAGETIQKLIERDGKVTAKSFLEESRPENAATHGLFLWDDAEAAEHWRLGQSSLVIRKVRIVRGEDADGEAVAERFVMAIRRCEAFGGGSADYYPVSVVMNNAELRQLAINDALRSLSQARIKVAEYKELEKIHAAIVKVEDALVLTQGRLRHADTQQAEATM